MAMSQIMDAMLTLGGDAEFGKMFDEYIQKNAENTVSKDGEDRDQNRSPNPNISQNNSVSPNVAQNGPHNHQMHPHMQHHPQYQHNLYQQGNGGHPQHHPQNSGYNPPHPPQHYEQQRQMRPQYHPQIGHGHPSQYHPQQRYYAPNGQPHGYMMGPNPNQPTPNHPNQAYGPPMRVPHPGQMHPNGYPPRPPMMLPGVSPNSGVLSPGSDMVDELNQYGQPGQWPSTGGKVKAKPRAPKKRSSKKKDPNEPTKPASAYALFFRERQAMIKGQNPNASFGEISKIVAAMWDVLEPEIKAIFKSKTEDAKKDYLQALAAYRASGVATGDQVSPYPSPSAYPNAYSPVASPTQSESPVPLVPPPTRSPIIPPNIPAPQQIAGNAPNRPGTHPNHMPGTHPNHMLGSHPNHMPGPHPNHMQGPHPNHMSGSHPNHMQGPHPSHMPGSHSPHGMMPHGIQSGTNPSVNPNHRLSPQIPPQYPNHMPRGNSSPHPDQQVSSPQYDPYGYPNRQPANQLQAGQQSFQGEFNHYASDNPKPNPHAMPINGNSMQIGHIAYAQPSPNHNNLYGQPAGSPGDQEDGSEDGSSQSDYDPNQN